MKKIMCLVTVLSLGCAGFSFGGECVGGFCYRPAGRVVVATKSVTREVVKLPRKVVNKCVNGRCNKTR